MCSKYITLHIAEYHVKCEIISMDIFFPDPTNTVYNNLMMLSTSYSFLSFPPNFVVMEEMLQDTPGVCVCVGGCIYLFVELI